MKCHDSQFVPAVLQRISCKHGPQEAFERNEIIQFFPLMQAWCLACR